MEYDAKQLEYTYEILKKVIDFRLSYLKYIKKLIYLKN